MEIKKLASKIAKSEGKKSQATIGDIREILSILADMSFESPEPLDAIMHLGIVRAKLKKNVSKS